MRFLNFLKIVSVLFFTTNFAYADPWGDLTSILFGWNDSGVYTDAVYVKKDGVTIYENYTRKYDAFTKHLSWSMAKTVSGIMIAQAIDQGLLKLDDKVKKFYPEFKTEATIEDLLQMSSGIKFSEEYTGVPTDSDVTQMLYLKGPRIGFAEYVTSRSARKHEKPGKHFYYSSGDTNVLMGILKKAVSNDAKYDAWPFKQIFEPLEIRDATFEQDSTGVFVGSSYLYLSAKSFAKIGELISKQGKYKNQQIIPEWYFRMMTEVAPGVREKALAGTSQTRAYSMQVTTNLPIPGRTSGPEYPELPSDALLLIGHQGQLIVASPSQNLVIVRLASDKGSHFNRHGFLKATQEVIAYSLLGQTTENEANTLKTTASKSSSSNEKTAAGSFLSKLAIWKYQKVPKLIKSMAAKELCSCLFITKRTLQYCINDLRILVPTTLPNIRILNEEVDFKAMKDKRYFNPPSGTTVMAYFDGGPKWPAKAEFRGPQLGCRLVTDP